MGQGYTEWDTLASLSQKSAKGPWASTGFNLEYYNSDLDTSNESIMSSDSDEAPKLGSVQLTREAKALVGRRFSNYFNKIGILPEIYWNQMHQDYQKNTWIKLTFDG